MTRTLASLILIGVLTPCSPAQGESPWNGAHTSSPAAQTALSADPRSGTAFASLVNPFIGTAGGGNTFPGAVRPWGMVSVSPHTDLAAPSGYIHGRRFFYGLGHVHLSGTGCSDLGSVLLTVVRTRTVPDPEEWKTSYDAESASPGYYRVRLPDAGILVEATSTVRCGLTRIVTERDGRYAVLLDAGRSLGLVGGGSVTVCSPNEVEGYNAAGGFCGEATRHQVFFVARLSRPALSAGTWIKDRWSDARACSVLNSPVGAWLEFSGRSGEELLVAVGISYVSIANARRNLDAELQDSFEATRAQAEGVWEEELRRVEVEGGSAAQRTMFYTALYHALLHPGIISDVSGEYPLMGRTGVGLQIEGDRYSVYSLWDTYRTLHPLLTLLYPERQRAMVGTMVAMSRESGWLPKWELAGNETYMMVGDPAPIVIADTYVKGLEAGDLRTAYEAARRASTDESPGAEAARPGYRQLLRAGYIPADQDTTQQWWVWGPVSTTLEYCLADWNIARLAERLGLDEDAREYDRRSGLYRNLFDSTTMFFRPRNADGTWLSPFDPVSTEGSGNWTGSGGPGYVEGNAWNYAFFTPHSVAGLAALFGGEAALCAKLEEFFARGHFTITNEPDIAYPYLFTYFPGREHRTQELVRSTIERSFGVGADGLPGNDDAGTISAWLVFSALGFYPACPGSTEYRLGIPMFERATLHLSPPWHSGTTFTVTRASSAAGEAVRFTPSLNGRALDTYVLDHRAVVSGGRLHFVPLPGQRE